MAEPSQKILICHSARSFSEELMMMGIRRFAISRTHWDFGYILPVEVEGNLAEVLGKWRPDGILVITRAELVPALMNLDGVPVVAVDPSYQCPSTVSSVRIDDRAIGRRAAEYLLSKRYEQMALVSHKRKPAYAERRMEGFLQGLEEKGITACEFCIGSNYARPWQENPELDEWLLQLPRPLGMFCVRDSFAQQVCDHLRRNHIRVPGDFSVLGAGNHKVLCESVQPRLSSIPEPVETLGFQAAVMLEKLMCSLGSESQSGVLQEELEPGEVVERQSTSLRSIPDPAIAKAAHYLLEHTLTGGTISEAVRLAGLNRKAMERGFKKYLGITPGQFMTGVRIDHARRLLTTTDLPMWEIAEACALTQNHFSYLFRTSQGMSPKAYRRQMNRLSSPLS